MTTEEKVKAYDEALERAKEQMDACGGNDGRKNIIRFIFPELAESKDEKIRKRLVEYFEAQPDHYYFLSFTKEEILSCLEKQKEQKPADVFLTEETCNDLINKIKKLHNDFCEEIMPSISHCKPAEWSERHIADIFEKVGLAKIAREQGNDKLTNALQDAMLELSKVENAEWSEEDETNLKDVQKFLFSLEDLPHTTYVRLDSWLKSLRPQPHWKPSEEQVSILGKVFAGCELNTTERDSMVDLFYHLKDMI